MYRRHQPPKKSSLTSSSGELPVPGAAAGLAGCARAKGPGRKLVLAIDPATVHAHDRAKILVPTAGTAGDVSFSPIQIADPRCAPRVRRRVAGESSPPIKFNVRRCNAQAPFAVPRSKQSCGASRTHAAREPYTPASNSHAHRVHVRPPATLAPSYPLVPPHALTSGLCTSQGLSRDFLGRT